MSEKNKIPRVAIVTLIQEGAIRVGGEHAMLFPYVEQILKAAETVKEKIAVIPYVISPRPKKYEKLDRVEELKEKMTQMNGGRMILVSNGAAGPYANPWNWEKYGHETNKALIKLVKEDSVDVIIVMAHGYASIPAVLDFIPSKEAGSFGNKTISNYYITHSTFDEHKDNRPQRRMLEREIQNHAKMIAISPYMAKHLEEIKLVKNEHDTVPLYNALPESGWFSNRISKEETLMMIKERNQKVNSGPFYGNQLPVEQILEGEKELVLYFGRAQKYVKGTDAVIACARNDPKRHYFLICSGSNEELHWHKELIKNLENVTISWEHNSKLVLGTVQLTEEESKARIYAVFLSRREPMGLVSRELVLMQKEGSVLPIVSSHCGFEDEWQKKFGFIATNPSLCEDDPIKIKTYSQLAKQSEIFVHDDCIKDTLKALDQMSNLSLEELRKRVQNYSQAVKINYSQNRYWSFYLQAIGKILPNFNNYIEELLKENKLNKIQNI
ncbi:MAG: hypothetical protein EAX90_06125 [Candidatus Heimdallarchaeota archaeon]|nr:hypothetical protein [Candidatus Heimdallarchaeota archaeon]